MFLSEYFIKMGFTMNFFYFLRLTQPLQMLTQARQIIRLNQLLLNLSQLMRLTLSISILLSLTISFSCLSMNNNNNNNLTTKKTSAKRKRKPSKKEIITKKIKLKKIDISEDSFKPVPVFLSQLKNALKCNDIFTITQSFDNLIKLIPQELQDPNHNEGFYHSLIHTLLRFTDYTVYSDIPTGSGEADTYIRTADNIYLFEFKINEKNAQEKRQKSIILDALKQIFENDYYKQNHQDDVPMTLAGISFHGASNYLKIKDNFTHLSCASLELKKNPSTLRAYPFTQPNQSIGDHNEAPSLCIFKNWNQFFVQKDDSMDDAQEVIDDPYSSIDTYHPNLRNIQKGLLSNDIPLLVKNIECILHAIPWSLRKFNNEYFQAIFYTSLLCAGIQPTLQDNVITIQKSEQKYKLISFFTKNPMIQKVKKDLLKKFPEYITQDDLNENQTVIMLNINQPEASKIQLISEGVMIKDKKIYKLDGKTEIKSLDELLIENVVIASPQTEPRLTRSTISQDNPPSPYQSPRFKSIRKKTILQDNAD